MNHIDKSRVHPSDHFYNSDNVSTMAPEVRHSLIPMDSRIGQIQLTGPLDYSPMDRDALEVMSNFEQAAESEAMSEASVPATEIEALSTETEAACEHVSRAGELTNTMEIIVRDLQARVDRLLHRTRVRSARDIRPSNRARSHSLPSDYGRCLGRAIDDELDSIVNSTSDSNSEQSQLESSLSGSSPDRRSHPETLVSLSTEQQSPVHLNSQERVGPRRSLTGSSDGESVTVLPSERRGRTRSEPPRHRLKPILHTVEVPGAWTSAIDGTDNAERSVAQQNCELGTSFSSLKRPRKNSDGDNGSAERRGEDRGEPSRKRNKIGNLGSPKNKSRFPCIFHIGEPDIYEAHTKRYEYIAQLL